RSKSSLARRRASSSEPSPLAPPGASTSLTPSILAQPAPAANPPSSQCAAQEQILQGLALAGDLDHLSAGGEADLAGLAYVGLALDLDEDQVGPPEEREALFHQVGRQGLADPGKGDLGPQHLAAEELAEGAALHHLALAEDGHPVAHGLHVTQDVGGEEDG